MKSSELYQRAKKVAPGGVHSPVRAFNSVGGEPMFFKSASGAYIESVEGKRYIDFCQSFGPNILGHRDPDVQAVVCEMVNTAWSLGTCEVYSLELAEWMVSRLKHVDKVRFVCSGTEAVMSALRLARGATGREKILKFNGCYHGHVDNMLVKSGSGLAGLASSDSAGVSESVAQTTIVCDLDSEESLDKAFLQYGSEIAAVIIEPLPANYGLLKQRKEFLQHLADTARKHGALVIFDEVISGFRVGLGGMAEKLDIQPDLVTYGKIIGGGFPVGCYAGRADLMDMMAPVGSVYQAGTLAANPIGMCAGLRTLQKIEEKQIYKVLQNRTDQFVKQIRAGFEKYNIPMEIQSEASLFWLHKVAKTEVIRDLDGFADDHADGYAQFFHACIKRGIYLAPSAYEVGFISYAHTDEILNQATNSIIQAAKECYV